jgi:hypothetical protein
MKQVTNYTEHESIATNTTMKPQLIYISGKIGDLEKEVYEKHFNDAKKELNEVGFDVVSPIELPHDHDKSWFEYMIEDLKALKPCDGIYMLNNYHDSPGALIELAFAKRMGKRIIFE